MKNIAKHRFALREFLILVPIMGLSMATGCGGGGTSFSSGGGGNLFNDECRISDPDFPFCGKNIVGCRNQDETLYDIFDAVCPPGWTRVPADVPFPDLACKNPEGETFQVDAAQCPPGWTEFTLTL